jgi:hypothetical protein
MMKGITTTVIPPRIILVGRVMLLNIVRIRRHPIIIDVSSGSYSSLKRHCPVSQRLQIHYKPVSNLIYLIIIVNHNVDFDFLEVRIIQNINNNGSRYDNAVAEFFIDILKTQNWKTSFKSATIFTL